VDDKESEEKLGNQALTVQRARQDQLEKEVLRDRLDHLEHQVLVVIPVSRDPQVDRENREIVADPVQPVLQAQQDPAVQAGHKVNAEIRAIKERWDHKDHRVSKANEDLQDPQASLVRVGHLEIVDTLDQLEQQVK